MTLTLILPAHLGLFETGAPTVLSPLPVLTVIPLLYVGGNRLTDIAILLVPALFFAIWNPQLFRGEGRVPKRTVALFGVAIVLNAAWTAIGWNWGLHYQGARYVHLVTLLNAVWILTIGLMFLYLRRSKTAYWQSLAIHWMLFAWLAWYAFPYLGELP
jgi:hypothetical protein